MTFNDARLTRTGKVSARRHAERGAEVHNKIARIGITDFEGGISDRLPGGEFFQRQYEPQLLCPGANTHTGLVPKQPLDGSRTEAGLAHYRG